MVLINRRKWSTNNDQHEPEDQNQTKTYNDGDKIDINKFLLIGEEDGEKTSLNTMNALWYALTLEPVAVQNERCIMFFECIAIFGALLVGAVWIIFEWRYSTMVERYNTTLDRVFDCIMGIALISNVFLTVLASWFWMESIMVNSSQENYLVACLRPITVLVSLVMFTTIVVIIGLGVGVVSHFYGHAPEISICITLLLAIGLIGERIYHHYMIDVMSLEIYHCFIIGRFMMNPLLEITGRDKLKHRAELRAQQLRNQYRIDKQQQQHNWESLDNLLRTAVTNLGRTESSNVSEYIDKLEKDWLTSDAHLRGRDIVFLNKYMPLLLAEEVHRLLKVK